MANLSKNISDSYFAYARTGNAFAAYSTGITSKVYTTTTGMTGPLLWNGTTDRVAIILGITCAVTTAATAAGAIGIAGGVGQSAAPTSTTAITLSGCTRVSAATSGCTVYNVGTVATAANFFMPFIAFGSGALTVTTATGDYIDIAGSIVVPQNTWVSVCATATDATLVAGLGLIWAESFVR